MEAMPPTFSVDDRQIQFVEKATDTFWCLFRGLSSSYWQLSNQMITWYSLPLPKHYLYQPGGDKSRKLNSKSYWKLLLGNYYEQTSNCSLDNLLQRVEKKKISKVRKASSSHRTLPYFENFFVGMRYMQGRYWQHKMLCWDIFPVKYFLIYF